ncbi:MAG: ATP-binding protein [Alphaproteobacteria bacterium]
MAQDISSNRRYYHSSSFKMALLFTVLLGLGVLVMGYFGYYFSRGYLIHGTEEMIDTEIRYLGEMPDLAARINAAPARGARLYLLTDRQGARIAGNMPVLPDSVSLLAEGTVVFATDSGARYAAKIHTLPDGRYLLVAVDITATAASLSRMQWLSAVGIFLMMLVILTSFMISTFVVSRTNRIARTAKQIMDTGNLSQRIVIDSRWDDLSNMSRVLNAFLARLEDLLGGVQRVSDNIAHDLRTPLTRMRNSLEALRKRAQVKNDADLGAACDGLLAEADHLLGTFNALLRIARIETGRQRGSFDSLPLHRLAFDVIELYEPLAEEKDIRITADITPAEMYGDRDLLFQALANLLDNAIKFSPPGSKIHVHTARSAAGGAVLEVSDGGPGIPAPEREKVFQRFYRGEASRHTAGNGLGLSLVGAIAVQHGGQITLGDAAPGLRVRIDFPPHPPAD